MIHACLPSKMAKLALALNFFQIAHAFQIFSDTTVPGNLTAGCTSALLQDISCSPVVAALQSGSYYPVSTLNNTCTDTCRIALSKYQSNIVSACNGQTWNGYEDTAMPLTIIPDLLRYQFNLTCLMDSGRYCNNVAAVAAFALDPGSKSYLKSLRDPNELLGSATTCGQLIVCSTKVDKKADALYR